MINVLFTLFIFPIEQILGLCFIFVLRIIRDPALSILGISFTVSILTLPLYLVGEKHQRLERDIQKQMKPEVDNIRNVFSGDERFMRLAVYYRQNGYHPLYSLRSSIPLIIQLPFFIAAYHFLSNMKMINSVSFGQIADLGKPDSLLIIRDISINILPIIMTLINLISATIYLRGSPTRDKIQLYGMAVLFLILLYNSPSALTLYWTGNNLFSLVKNIIQKTKRAKQITLACVSALYLILNVYLLFFHIGSLKLRISIVLLITVIFLFKYLRVVFIKIKQILFNSNKIFGFKTNIKTNNNTTIFILSLLFLFILAGFVIPSSLIASSVQEFSFTSGEIINPYIFIVNVILQSAGIFLLWPLLLYFFFSQELKNKVTELAVVICMVAVINLLIFPGYYGFMTINFTFSDFRLSNMTFDTPELINLFVLTATAMLGLFLIRNFRKAVHYGLIIAVFAMFVFGLINNIKINKEFQSLQPPQSRYVKENDTISYEPVFQFSKTGKNVLVILLDMAVSGYIPYIFNERQDLYNSFNGFTWYKNSISFGAHTLFGSLGIFGGYEYTPLEIKTKNHIYLEEKRKEALLMLPRIFLDKGYKVTVTDLESYSYTSNFFDNYPEIHAENIVGGKYATNRLLESGYREIIVNNTTEKIMADMIRFSFFKIAPLLFRSFIYDYGNWLDFGNIPDLDQITLDDYIALDILDKITKIETVKFDTYTVIANALAHRSAILQPPDYVPANGIIDRGKSPFANDNVYHVHAAALLLLGKWFDFLKENDVYDNTRIIIVSDHGNSLYGKFQDSIILPNKDSLNAYTALLLVKDFNQHGYLSIDDSFMTNADVPIIALEGIVNNPVNPWTEKIIKSDKEGGITITTSHSFFRSDVFDIKPNEWLHVHTNIYNPKNWSQVNKP
jgi:YidC/Oxa1 family membrane protein insertase